MKKKFAYLSVLVALFAMLLLGRFVTVYASNVSNREPNPNPTPICAFNANAVEDGKQFYFSEDGECLQEPVTNDFKEFIDDRVPTSVQLISTTTEIRDPVSIVGIMIIFFVLIGLTIFWLTIINKWNQHSLER